MKIAIVTPAVPHPFGDTAARWFYVLVTGLVAQGHRVTCLTASGESPERVNEARARLSSVAKDGDLDFRWYPVRSPVSVLRRKARSLIRPFSEILYAPGLKVDLDKVIREGVDVLHLEEIYTGWLGLNNQSALLNVLFVPWIDNQGRSDLSFGERKSIIQMNRATRKIVSKLRNICGLTSRIVDSLRPLNPGARFFVVPLGLDTTIYPLQPVVQEPVVGLVGSMHWYPSRSAGVRLLTRIWPIIKRKVPSAKLLVAGWNAQKYLAHYLPMPDVEMRENLPHPTDFFSKAAVMVYAPSRGSGMKIKVMESMAYGVPVVTTWEGVEGLSYTNGEHCWVEEDDQALADCAVRLLMNPTERRHMREAARALIEDFYSPRPVLEQMLDVYAAIT